MNILNTKKMEKIEYSELRRIARKTTDCDTYCARTYECENLRCPYPNCVKAGFEAGISFAQQWYSVEDELPEVFGEFLAKNVYDDLNNQLYNKEGDAIEGEGTRHILMKRMGEIDSECIEMLKSYNVTHWRHIELK